MKKELTGSLAFDGAGECGCYGYNSKYQTNASGAKAKENYGRGPTRGNTNGQSVPNPTAGNPSMKQVRNHGTTAVPKASTSINVGRGPTKVGSK